MARIRFMRLVLSWPGRLAITIALLGALGFVIDWDTARARLQGGDWPWFAAAILLLNVAFLLGTLRWQLLLSAAGLPVRFRFTLLLYYFGTFANSFLPTGFGGDVARAVVAGRGGAISRAATTVTVDRLTAAACLFLLAILAATLQPAQVPVDLRQAVYGTSLILTSIGIVLLLGLRSGPARRLLTSKGALRDVKDTLVATLADGQLTIRLAVIGVAYQAVSILSVACVGRAIDLRLPFALLAVILPLILIATLIPISIGGLGIREGGFALLLGAAGVDPASATVLSLLTVATLALASLPGLVVVLHRRTPPTASAQPSRTTPT